jgi:hypothetical protein
MVETVLLAASASATAAGTSAALATAGGVATAAQVAATTGGMIGSTLAASAPFVGSLFTAGSAFGQIQAGRQSAAISSAQARQYELQARQEELRGREQADAIRRSLQASLASQRAIFGARGINPNTGSPLVLSQQSRTEAGADIETAMYNSGATAEARRMQGAQSRLEGKVARSAGYQEAGTTLYGARGQLGSLLR